MLRAYKYRIYPTNEQKFFLQRPSAAAGLSITGHST